MMQSVERLDRFYSYHLGVDMASIIPGELRVVGSPKRAEPGTIDKTVSVLWTLCSHGRCVISAHPQIVAPLRAYAQRIGNADELRSHTHDAALLTLCKTSAPSGDGEYTLSGISVKFTCDAVNSRFLGNPNCRSLRWDELPSVWQYLRDGGIANTEVRKGTTFVYYYDEQPVACAGAVRLDYLTDEIAEIGSVYTAEHMRQRGFGASVVAEATNALLLSGRSPLYSTNEKNLPSQRTALAVRYREYGWMFLIWYRLFST